MSAFDSAKDALKMLDATVEGLETIQKLTNVGGSRAGEALTAISLVIEVLLEGFAGKTSPDVVRAQLKTHLDAISAGDDAAQKAIHDRFDGGGETP